MKPISGLLLDDLRRARATLARRSWRATPIGNAHRARRMMLAESEGSELRRNRR
jgi:hypothetical protein